VIDTSAIDKLTTESVPPRTYSFNPEKNIAIDAMSSFEKHKDIRSIDIDSKHLLCEKSIASGSEGKDFVNNFQMHDCVNDNKIRQKLCIHAHDSDQISPITYNDISYNLGQKSSNGSDSKDGDRYDKRLNQSNIKPSISNVFNSLNEYINAPTRNLDYVEHVLDKTDDLSKMSVNITIKDFKSNKVINEETSKEKEIIAVNTMDYRDNQSVKLDAFLEIGDKCDNVIPNIASQHLILMQSEKKNSNITTSTSSTAVQLRQEHDNVAINIETSNNEAAINEKILFKNKTSFQEISKNIIDKQKQLDTKIQKPINKVILVENKENVMECMKSDGNVINDKSNNEETVKYYDVLSNVCETHMIDNDFSEKELNRYLLELEKEEEKSKIQNTLCVNDSLLYDESKDIEAKSTNQHEQDDEDINEAPIFEKIMIGELPKISEEIFQEKAKKFPVIDYGINMAYDEDVNVFPERTDLREFNDTMEIVSSDKSNQLKDVQNDELNKVIKNNDISGPINQDLGMQNKARESQSTSSIIVTEKVLKLENVEEQYNSHNVLNTTQKLEQDIDTQNNDEVKSLSENENYNDRVHCRDMSENFEDVHDKHDNDINSKIKIISKIANVSTISQVDENGQETEKLSRPQTLDIISTHNKDSHILGMLLCIYNILLIVVM